MDTKLTKGEETLFRYLEHVKYTKGTHKKRIPLDLNRSDININARNSRNETALQLALRNNVDAAIILQILNVDKADVNLPTLYRGIKKVPFLQAMDYIMSKTYKTKQPSYTDANESSEVKKVPLEIINHPLFNINNDELFVSLKNKIHGADIKNIINNLEKVDNEISTTNKVKVRNLITIAQNIVLLWCYLAREEVNIDLNTAINGKSVITFGLIHKLTSFVKFLLQNAMLNLNVNKWDVYQGTAPYPTQLDPTCPLVLAKYLKEEHIVDLILKHKSFDSNALCNMETTDLHGTENNESTVIAKGDPLLICIVKFSPSDGQQLQLCKTLTNLPTLNINETDKHGNTSLMYAAMGKHKELFSLLIAHPNIDINMTNPNGNSCLNIAAQNDDTFVEELAKLPCININQADSSGKTALMYSAMLHNHDNFGILLQHPKINVNIKDNDGNTCLTLVVSTKSENDTDNALLLQLLGRSDLLMEDTAGKSAIIEALTHHNFEDAATLINHLKININEAFTGYKDSISPLQYIVDRTEAAIECSPPAIPDKSLRSKLKDSIKAIENKQRQLLYSPSYTKDWIMIISKLMQQKRFTQDITKVKCAKLSPLHLLVSGNCFDELADFMENRNEVDGGHSNIQSLMDIQDHNEKDIWEVLFENDNPDFHKLLGALERILKVSSIDVNKVFNKPYYGTLLHRAIAHRITAIIDIILKSDRVNPSTPAAPAAIFYNVPQAMTPISLIMKLYKPQSKVQTKKTAYFLDPVEGKLPVLTLLLAMVTLHPCLMEDINPIKTDDGLAVLHVLIKGSKFQAIDTLLNNRKKSKFNTIDPFTEDSKGISVWEAMCISYQLHSQYEPTRPATEYRINQLIKSMEQGLEKLAMQDNIDIHQKNHQGKTMFHFTCIYGVNALAGQFLKMPHVDINIQDQDGYTPFMYGIGQLRADILVEYLNHPECKIHTQNKYKQTIQTIYDSMKPSKIDPRVRSLITAAFSKAKENEASTTQMLSELGIPEQLLFLKKSLDKDAKLSPGEKKRFLLQIEGMEKDYTFSNGSNPESQHSMVELHTKRLLRKRVYLCDEMTPRDVFDYLIEDGVLNVDDVEKIKLEGTWRGMCQALVSLLPRCGDKAYSSLIRALTESGQSHVAQELENYNPDEPQQPTQDTAGQALQVFGQTGVAMAGQGVLMPVQVTSDGYLALPFYTLNSNTQ